MAITNKQTIYIDIDDEITAIIDKVKTCPEKIVALVLPKRATVLQSIVNMKLLKKSALKDKKSIVLITSEAGLLPLAGAVGLHVAKSLQSKPIIPLAPDRGDSDETEISEEESTAEPVLDKNASIGALAAAKDANEDDDLETIELDDEKTGDSAGAAPKKKHLKGFKVPNFDRFRLSFFLGILGVVVLIVGWILAVVVLPSAKVVISTDTSSTVSTISFTASTALKDLDLAGAKVPAVQKEVKKTDTEKTTASGSKDTGAKATGTITIYDCSDNDKLLPAGTVFTSGSYSFTSDSAVTVPASDFNSSAVCKKNRSATVAVTATKTGTEANLAAGSNLTSSSSSISASNENAFGGGTPSAIIKIVSQDDVDNAAAKMKGRQDATAKTDLATLIRTDNLKSLDETLLIGAPAVTSVPAVGAEAAGDVTVTAVTTYDILAVKADYLSQLIKKDVATKIDTNKQSILDDGLGKAVIHVTTAKSPTESVLNLQALVVAGPQLNADSIKEEIKGKKRGDAEKIITSKPGVKDVTITYKPFWVLSTPKSVKKIHITIEKPPVTATTGTNSSNP